MFITDFIACYLVASSIAVYYMLAKSQARTEELKKELDEIKKALTDRGSSS